MNLSDFGNEALSAFMQDKSNYGYPAVLGNHALVKINLDERFDLLGGFGGAEENEKRQVLRGLAGAGFSAAQRQRYAFFDTRTGELYDVSYDMYDLASSERLRDVQGNHLTTVAGELEQDIKKRLTEYVNDPSNHDSLVAASRAAEPDYVPYIDPSDLKEQLIAGKSIEDVSEEPVMVPFKLNEDDRINAAMEYLKRPGSTAGKYFDEACSKDKAEFGKYLLKKEAFVDEYTKMAASVSPNIIAVRNVQQALDRAFPDPKSKPNKLWITVARDGKEITFQYPFGTLRHVGDTWLPDYHITPIDKREEFNRLFGKHYTSGHLSSGEFFAEDVVDISYRGRSVYSVSDEVRHEKTAVKDVEVQIYALDDDVKQQMFEKPRLQKNFDEDAAVKIPPERFTYAAAQTATVGAYSDAQTVCDDICRQIQDPAVRKTGNLIVTGGKAYMIPEYHGCLEMPFPANALSKAAGMEWDRGEVSLSSEQGDMLAARNALSNEQRDMGYSRSSER